MPVLVCWVYCQPVVAVVSGDAVADVLGEAGGGTGDLNAVLSGVGGLATASSAGQRSRLGSRGAMARVTGSADVNELLSGVGICRISKYRSKGFDFRWLSMQHVYLVKGHKIR